MHWKDAVKDRLCREGWVSFHDLFEEVEQDIPLHQAFRRARLDLGEENTKSIVLARLRVFKIYLNEIDVDTYPVGGSHSKYDYQHSRVKLPVARGFLCGSCYGAVVQCCSRLYCRKCESFVKPLKYPVVVAA